MVGRPSAFPGMTRVLVMIMSALRVICRTKIGVKPGPVRQANVSPVSPFRGSAEPTQQWQHFRFECTDQVAIVTLDRPDKLNALTFEAYADLRDLLAQLPQRGDVRALVLRGAGRAFCSGGDISEIIGATLRMGQDELLAFTRMTGEVIRGMRECPIPIVAALQGMAAGAGAVIALAADFRVATPAARCAFLFTKVGLSGGDMGAAYL